jgi:hypothetical protein
MATMRRTLTTMLTLTGLALGPRALAADAHPVILEAAPLRSVMGHPAVRLEVLPVPFAGVALGYETSDAPSERADYRDTRSATTLEGLWYPQIARAAARGSGPFVAAGLSYEQAAVGRERQSDSVTWVRTTSNDGRDLWVNHDTYLATTQAVGYRFVANGLVTAALRLERNETMQQSSRVERDQVVSRDPDLTSDGRAPVTTRLVLHAGVLLK